MVATRVVIGRGVGKSGLQRGVQRAAVPALQMEQPHPTGVSFDELSDRRGLVGADVIAFQWPGSVRSSGGKGRSWMVRIGCSKRGRRVRRVVVHVGVHGRFAPGTGGAAPTVTAASAVILAGRRAW
jgi:hypothetical protein